ncbi:MAG: hypothetical protein H7842_07715 [Gammaproteobacteria bacterium SHHR-1]|uniref:mechanosensitive ion channel family protein n=1 Tax=Magnetovirga frankeli TaxID=947516 RepID=UPI0012937A8A|nr:hypothetical protein D5125_12820 [gamma proteobacterium SS-5]
MSRLCPSRPWLPLSRLALLCLLLMSLAPLWAAAAQDALPTLHNLVQLRQTLQTELDQLRGALAAAESDTEKAELRKRLASVQQDLRTTQNNFEDLAAGVRLARLKGEAEEPFNLQQELLALLRPALEEMKSMTSQMRKKADLKERIAQYSQQLPQIHQALGQIQELRDGAGDEALRQALDALAEAWRTQQALLESELQSAQFQLQSILQQEVSLTEASQNYLKNFFQKRGLYLGMALLLVLGIALLSRLNHYLLRRLVPGFTRPQRSFRVRLIELIHLVGTLLLMVLGPILVFYLVEDWVLLSIAILILLALALTLRHTLPSYVQQIQLFLNIGTVREGERLQLDGLPWQVKRINVFCTLVNPDANLTQRLHIDKLVGMRSRPYQAGDPWFPCRQGDWVILRDGVRGQVMGISEELVLLQERGGAWLTYATLDFIAASPRNISQGFRLKEVIGLSYGLQRAVIGDIPGQLLAYLRQRLEQEGYAPSLRDLKVELGLANSSSLDLVMIADFSGDVAELYGRLRRVLQRLAIEACAQQGWEIPFPQLQLHGLADKRP